MVTDDDLRGIDDAIAEAALDRRECMGRISGWIEHALTWSSHDGVEITVVRHEASLTRASPGS